MNKSEFEEALEQMEDEATEGLWDCESSWIDLAIDVMGQAGIDPLTIEEGSLGLFLTYQLDECRLLVNPAGYAYEVIT